MEYLATRRMRRKEKKGFPTDRARLLLGVALLLATGLSIYSAISGLNWDQAVSYEAALRQIQGQALYTDFHLPHGPLAGWLFVPFLLLAPTGGFAQVLASVVLNVAATLLMWSIVRRTTNEHYAGIAAIITAVWFLPVIGGYYHDHVSYAFVLAAIWAFLSLRKPYGHLLAGVSLALAFHAKQTVGAIGLVAFIIAAVVIGNIKKKDVWWFAAGYLAVHIIVLGVIAYSGGLYSYINDTYLIPKDFASADKNPLNLVIGLLLPYLVKPWSLLHLNRVSLGGLAFYPLVLLVYCSYYVLWSNWRRMPQRTRFVLVALLLSTLWTSAFVGRSFTEVALGIGGIVAITFFSVRERYARVAIPAVVISIVVIGLAFVIVNSLSLDTSFRTDKDGCSFKDTDLFPITPLQSDLIVNTRLTEVCQVLSFLRERPGSVATLDDTPFLIPLALRSAPLDDQLVYHNGLTIPKNPVKRRQWEEQYIKDLTRTQPKYIITTLGYGSAEWREEGTRQLDSLPLLKTFLSAQYVLVYNTTTIRVFEKGG